jgi:hypothetical protein
MLETFRLYSTLNIKNPSFHIKIIYKNKKALQQRPKGWKCLGSPYWKALELLREILHLKI